MNNQDNHHSQPEEEISLHSAVLGRTLLHWTLFLALAFVFGIGVEMVRRPDAPLAKQIKMFWEHGGIFMLAATICMVISAIDIGWFSKQYSNRLSQVGESLRQIADVEQLEKADGSTELAQVKNLDELDDLDELAESISRFREHYLGKQQAEPVCGYFDPKEAQAPPPDNKQSRPIPISDDSPTTKQRSEIEKIVGPLIQARAAKRSQSNS